jgi:hypothetical protein
MARQREQPKGAEAWERLRYEREKRRTAQGICRAAASGDEDSARKALRYVAELIVAEPEKIPEPVRCWLEGCLVAILAGEEPAQALNLKRKPHQREYPPIDYWRMVRDADMARGVAHLIGEGMTFEAAAHQVANTYSAFSDKAGKVGYESVRKAYLRFFPAE